MRTEGVERAQRQWQEGGEEGLAVVLKADVVPPTRRQVSWTYWKLGFTHILPKGLDHILFVVGIFLLSARWRNVLTQVSTFTIAHSITLGLTMYGVVSLPARVVEPMIALSIAYVAIENLVLSELKPWRVITRSLAGPSVTAVAVRGPWSMSAISPRNSPGPSVLMARPPRSIRTRPSTMRKNSWANSPSRMSW